MNIMHIKTGNILLGLLLLLTGSVHAKDIKYKVSDIPKELKENARSVVRNEEIVLEVKSLTNATVNVTYAITILNKNGLEDSYFQMFYDKFIKISGIRGRVFDENGEQIKKIPSDEILDYSAISGYTLYNDNRIKYIDPKVRNYPFTVEYSYEQSLNGLFSFPSWHPQPKFNLAVEKSSYKAIITKTMKFRYLERNTTLRSIITSDAENNIYSWEARNLKALVWEPYSVSDQDIFPYMIAAPTDFEVEGHKGNLTSWENFGNWNYDLIKDRNNLSEETKIKIKNLVSNENNDHEKIKKVYEYMQDKTRFVNVLAGIGDWQPIDAATVDRVSYGNCTALTNYTKSLLEAIKIQSYYCIVNAGATAPPIIREFPSNQFNHVILCVPLKSDTIWLECTNQRVPCGFIGDFTDDRDLLLIDNEKSKIVHTKVYGMADNKENHTSHVAIDENGKGSVEIHNVYTGLKYENFLPTFFADDADKKRRISERMKFPGFQVVNFKYKENKTIIPSIEETLKVDFENYLNPMGTRYFLLMNFSNRIADAPYSMRSRKNDVYIRRSSIEQDTIIYNLPAILKPESLPKQVFIKTQFGEYLSKVEYKNNQLCYTRSFQLYKGLYPKSNYDSFVDFFDKASVEDEMKCALIKK